MKPLATDPATPLAHAPTKSSSSKSSSSKSSSPESRRKKRLQTLFKASLRGCGIRTLLIIIELGGYKLYGSQLLLIDACASLFDLFSSGVMLIFILIAARPPDENHPMGHGRLEPIAGMQLALCVALAAITLIFRELHALIYQLPSEPLEYGALLFALIGFILMEGSYRYINQHAKQWQSPALESEALHYRIDALNSLAVCMMIFLGSYFTLWSGFIDRLGSAGIAATVLISALISLKRNFDQLTDRKPCDAIFETIRSAALSVEGVLDIEKICVQHYGPDAHVDIDVEVSPAMQVEEAHTISHQVSQTIIEKWPIARHVTVHIEPYQPKQYRG